MSRRIFISYAREDHEAVNALHADLTAAGFDAFFDSELTGGQQWWDTLLDEIRRCDVFIPIVTEDWRHSHACKLEADYASDVKRTVLPVCLDEESVKLLPARLVMTQSVTYSGEDKSATLRLIGAVNSLPAAKPLPDPRPVAPAVPLSYLTKLRDKVYVEQRLTQEEQYLVLAEFRRRMKEEEQDAEELRTLLMIFAKREDLYAHTAREIDALLATQTPPAMPATGTGEPAAANTPPAEAQPLLPPPTAAGPLAQSKAESVGTAVAASAQPGKGKLIWSYICSAGAIALSWLMLSFVLGPVAIILAHQSRKQGNPRGNRAWTIAWVCTVVGVVLSILLVALAPAE
jgi:hypothetical protein